jgi:magnesium transporter
VPPWRIVQHEPDVERTRSVLAGELSRLGVTERAARFRLLTGGTASAVFRALDPPDQRELLEALPRADARELLEQMEVDDRARLLDRMPVEATSRLLLELSDSERELTEVLLGYPAESAGRIMTPRYLDLRPESTVEQVLELIRGRSGDTETLLVLPVRDRDRRLEGVVRLTDLVRSRPDARMAQIMDAAYPAVSVSEDQESVARLIQEEDLLAVPVIDHERRLVGVVTVDDAMEVIEREETEDIALLAGGSRPLGVPYHTVSVRRLVRTRLVWLLFLVAAATLTVTVLGAFESTLQEVVTLAIFIPLLIGTGGNCGAQAATTMTRALALGEVRFSDLVPSVLKEAQVGLALGLFFGLLGFPLLTAIWTVEIAASVSLALIAICLWATSIGALLPLVSSRLGVDPAVVSAPLFTTFVDATGLLIYFGIAHLLVA